MALASESKPRKSPLVRAALFLWLNFDTLLCIALAIVAAWLATFGGRTEYAVGAIATSLGILAFGALKDRSAREELTQRLQSIKSLLERLLEKTAADDFFSRKTNERVLIEEAQEELLLIQETGRLLAETSRQELLAFLRKGGHLRWIVVADELPIATLMAMRNANLTTPELMMDRMRGGVRMIEVLAKEAQDAAPNIEVRFLPYPADITAVFRDPRHANPRDREALVRLQGFQVTFDDKLDFRLNAYDSGFVYDLYRHQAERMWQSSSKCIFLTGEPRIGKSTLLRTVVDRLTALGATRALGFLTKDLRNDANDRVGFETTTVDGTMTRKLATKLGTGQYELNPAAITDIIVPAISKALASPGSLLVLDEVGPIQLMHADFATLVRQAIDSTGTSVLGIVASEGHPFLRYVQQHIRCRIIHVTADNREATAALLLREFGER